MPPGRPQVKPEVEDADSMDTTDRMKRVGVLAHRGTYTNDAPESFSRSRAEERRDRSRAGLSR